MPVNHHEKSDFHNIEDAVHDDSEPEVEAVLERFTEGKGQELPVQPQVAHQIPTPVYLRVPLRQTGISRSRKKPHQIRQETIPVIHSSNPTFPSSTSVGNQRGSGMAHVKNRLHRIRKEGQRKSGSSDHRDHSHHDRQ